MVDQKQMDYELQPSLNCLEDKFDLNTKIANKIAEFRNE